MRHLAQPIMIGCVAALARRSLRSLSGALPLKPRRYSHCVDPAARAFAREFLSTRVSAMAGQGKALMHRRAHFTKQARVG